MAFDMGFNMRATAPYVSDPFYCVPVLGELYPHTYTNGDGFSINAGWINSRDSIGVANKNATVDPRIAGHNFPDYGGNGHATWQIDLSSGSAPGAGTYAIAMAGGSVGSGSNTQQKHILLDNTTQLFTFGPTTLTNQFVVDTTGAEYSAANWPGSNTAVDYAFASTTLNLELYVGFPTYWSMLAHFRLTLQEGGTNTNITPPTAVRIGA